MENILVFISLRIKPIGNLFREFLKKMDGAESELDSLVLSSRILAEVDGHTDFISGGILISNSDGSIKKIFTSQKEINSFLFRAHGTEVS